MSFWPLCCGSEAILCKKFRPGYPCRLECSYGKLFIPVTEISLTGRGPFLERPGDLTGPKSCFEIKVSRKVGRVLTSNKVNSVSLADTFTVQFSNLLEWKTKQLNGPGNNRELRETDPARLLITHRNFLRRKE